VNNIDDVTTYKKKNITMNFDHEMIRKLKLLHISLAYKNLLPKGIWDALMKINNFFNDICSNKLHTQHMKKFETNIIQTICKL
jgi:hypothetical protein